MDWTWLLSASAFALAMSATPGPNTTMVMASGATCGSARTVPHMLGTAAGFPVMLAVLGTARVLRTRRAVRLFNLAMAGLRVASLVPALRA